MQRLWREAFPLLLNSLLLTVFFRFDAILLRSIAGDTVLGLYDAAYKVISLTQIIPPYVVGALFPLLAQRAVHQPETLAPLVRRAILVLQWVAWMGVASVTIMANDLIWLIGGTQYLPEAANLLRVLIWYLPLSYATGVVQYALIATKQQRSITWAFAVGTVVNLAGNSALIPMFGGYAAAGMTIITEIALIAALWPTLRRIQLVLPVAPMLHGGLVTVIVTAIGWWLSTVGLPTIPLAIIAVTVIVWSAHLLGTLDRAVYTLFNQIKGRIR
jgi:O-antigen/teichoic acid export membrane protein